MIQVINYKSKKDYPASPNTYIFSFVEINSCEAHTGKFELLKSKKDFFTKIMKRLKKVVVLKLDYRKTLRMLFSRY